MVGSELMMCRRKDWRELGASLTPVAYCSGDDKSTCPSKSSGTAAITVYLNPCKYRLSLDKLNHEISTERFQEGRFSQS